MPVFPFLAIGALGAILAWTVLVVALASSEAAPAGEN